MKNSVSLNYVDTSGDFLKFQAGDLGIWELVYMSSLHAKCPTKNNNEVSQERCIVSDSRKK